MSISIELSNGCHLAEVKRISVHGLPGVGCYTLVINLYLSVIAPATDSDLSNLSIRVEWGDNQQRMIGTGVPDQAQPIPLTRRNPFPCRSTVTRRSLASACCYHKTRLRPLRHCAKVAMSAFQSG